MRKGCLVNSERDLGLSGQSMERRSDDELGEGSENVAFWLIDSTQSEEDAKFVVDKIRKQLQPNVYLKPIVIITGKNEKSGLMEDAAVGFDELNDQLINQLIARFEPVNQWIDNVMKASDSPDSGLVFKVLRLIASREGELKPEISPHKLTGFYYPLLDSVTSHDEGSLFRALELLESQKLISGKFITKSHYCCHCECAFLNFKEICPQCKSDDLTSHELIHHFKCSYVGEYPEFVQGDDLVCPKCDRKLKHIGVDFDKPSLIYRCNQCNNRFQEPSIVTQCFNCGRVTEPENQIMRSIKSYRCTAMGNNAAIYGLDSLFTKMLEPKFNLLSISVFKQFLQIEIERIKRYKISTSSLVLIRFDLESLYLKLGANAQDLFAELAGVFKTILRNSDIIASQNESVFALLLVETSIDNAGIALSRFEAGFNELIAHNFNSQIELSSHIEAVQQNTEISKSIESFLNSNVHR